MLSQFILKVVSRCDLSCDHCYVYEHPDQGWRRQPRVMAPSTLARACDRIAEHVTAHGVPRVRVVLHGGEPLLAGAAGLRDIAGSLRRRLDPVTTLDLRMQSNGVLLTQEICDVLVEHDVRVGISLDGDVIANDRHRRYANGASSHAEVRRALDLLRRPGNRSSYAGLLCTVDLANDPVRVYEALLAEEPPHIDFLLPHANWDRPPVRPYGVPAPYADWLFRIYTRWRADGRPVPVRLLDSLLSTAAGHASGTEAVGLGAADLVVIESDGSYEQVDSLKSAYPGAPVTGMGIVTHSVDEVAAHPMVAVRQRGVAGLSDTCRACAVVRQCGGGLFAHRYRTGSGFDNPSAYCADLMELIKLMRPTSPPTSPARRPDGPAPTDRLSDAVLDDLATGAGGRASMSHLVAVHEAVVRAHVVALSPRATRDPVAAAGWELLVMLDERAPEAVRSVLADPFVRRWAARCRTESDDLDHLACVAAAAAVRAGVDARLTVPVTDGAVHLPTLGRVDVGPAAAQALVTTDGAGWRVRAGHGTVDVRPGVPGWWPVRRIRAGRLDLSLQDTDPYRDCYPGLPAVAPRLNDAAVQRWRRDLDGAVRRIGTGPYAAGVDAVLRAVVPLRSDADGRQRSAAARQAFGAVAVTPVPDAAALELLLVHEVQHLKLGAVLDVCDLFERGDDRTLTVPWRDRPRPVEAALQGTYAFLAVADVWRTRPGAVAATRFRQYRGWVDGAVDALLGAGPRTRDGAPALTPPGARFVRRMRDTLDTW